MARAAGTFNANGIAATAAAIRSITRDEPQFSYFAAAGRIMIAQDLCWTDDEHAAIREAYDELIASEPLTTTPDKD